MDMGRRVESANSIEKGREMHGTVKVDYHGCACLAQPTGKTKTSKQYGSSFSLDAGRTAPNGGACTEGAGIPSYAQGDPVHWGHMFDHG